MLTAIALAAAVAFHPEVKGEGRPMVFIPGLACSGEVWEATAAHFRPKFQTHVLTLAGFAGQPAIDGELLPEVRRQLAAYLREHRLQGAIVVGHSLGASIALQLAADEPGLVGAVIAVDGVPFLPALMDPSATEEKGRAQAEALAPRIAAMTQEQYAAQSRMAAAGMAKDAAAQERIASWGARSSPKAVASAMADLMSHDRRPEMARVKAPVLLIGAAGFATTDAMRKDVQARYEAQVALAKNHRVVLAPEARHFIMMDSPKFLLDTMDAFVGSLR